MDPSSLRNCFPCPDGGGFNLASVYDAHIYMLASMFNNVAVEGLDQAEDNLRSLARLNISLSGRTARNIAAKTERPQPTQ